MATALQIAIQQGLDITKLEGGAERIAALAAESEREAMFLKAKGVPVFYERCDSCGSAIWYPSVAIQLAYMFCHVCGRQMLASADLKGHLSPVEERASTVVVSAMYGHLTDASRRVDVSEALRAKAAATGGRSIEVAVTENLKKLFGDPLPGIPKKLVLAVRMFDRVYTTEWEEYRSMPRDPIRVVADEHRASGELHPLSYTIQIITAVLGPPNNPLQASDVTAWLQRRILRDGGKRLRISNDENLAMNLKDPSPGNPKVLFIRYMMFNRRGFIKINVVEGQNGVGFYLERTIDFSASPTIPKLVMLGASFGHPAADTRTYDITELCQSRVDEAGGEWLDMKPEEDIHDWLGDPYVGSSKTLQVHYHLVAKEASLAVRERHTVLEEPVHIVAPVVAPRITVHSAKFVFDSYKLGQAPRPAEDVAPQIRRLIDALGGAKLEISTDVDVLQLLGLSDPVRLLKAGESFRGVGSVSGLSHISERSGDSKAAIPQPSARTAASTSKGRSSTRRGDEEGKGDDATAASSASAGGDPASMLLRPHSAKGQAGDESKTTASLGGKVFRKRADGTWEATGEVIAQAGARAGAGAGAGAGARPSETSTGSQGTHGRDSKASEGDGKSREGGGKTGEGDGKAGEGDGERASVGSGVVRGKVASVSQASVSSQGTTKSRTSRKRFGRLAGPRSVASRRSGASAISKSSLRYVKPVNHRLVIEYVDRGRRNYINAVAKEKNGEAYLMEGIKLFADLPQQAVVVTGAAYGHPTDAGKRVDVKELLQRRVKWHRDGARLDIDGATNVDDLFGNPCRGVFKVLVLRYRTVDTKGVYKIQVPGPGTPLGQHVRIGWKPGT